MNLGFHTVLENGVAALLRSAGLHIVEGFRRPVHPESFRGRKPPLQHERRFRQPANLTKHTMILQTVLLALAVLTGMFVQGAESPVPLTVQVDKPAHKISPYLYGIFFEDINYAADGGVYAELVQNR
jgi:hypothetical protein